MHGERMIGLVIQETSLFDHAVLLAAYCTQGRNGQHLILHFQDFPSGTAGIGRPRPHNSQRTILHLSNHPSTLFWRPLGHQDTLDHWRVQVCKHPMFRCAR